MTQPVLICSNPPHWRVAVIGSGPSGFYAVGELLKQKEMPVKVDLFDRLPTPYGLVRGGVAPDHQNIKRVAKSYDRLLKTENIRFIGNVTLGTDIQVSELEERYHVVMYATGNEAARKLNIPGEDLNGVHSATEFVFWYNGHPDYCTRQFSLQDGKRIAIIGNGNVSIDVARIIAKRPDKLAETDIAEYALAGLKKCPVEEVLLLGRRGPAQSAFSPKEIEELAALDGSDLTVLHKDIEQSNQPHNLKWLENDAPPTAQKNMDFLREQVKFGEGEKDRKIRCCFYVSPTEFLGKDGRLTHMRLQRNQLVEKNGRLSARSTGEEWLEEVQLVFKAIGYRGIPIPGVPFDDWRGIIPNVEGRVIDLESNEHKRGHYVVGWAKRGPTGLIGTNRSDAEDTVEILLKDVNELSQREIQANDILELLSARGVRTVDSNDWFVLDQEELRRGKEKEKVRDKFTSVEAMLQFLDQQ